MINIKYNRQRLHGSIACLTLYLFWELWEKGLVKKYKTEKGRIKFKVLIPYWKLSGNENLREFPSFGLARRAS